MALMDDKSEHVIPFLLKQLEVHRKEHGNDAKPFFLGLNGVQGVGKSTLVETLSRTLESDPHKLRVAVISLDDFYLKHSDQVSLARSQPTNPLVQHRGQPATHDLELLVKILSSLQDGNPTSLPSYDKSQFAGAGDRAPESSWTQITTPLDVLILEGWCVGFKSLSQAQLRSEWENATKTPEVGQLGKLKYRDVEFVNEALQGYEEVWDRFAAFVHIDAAETEWVYDWRLEAEVKMREVRGVDNAMSDAQVKAFVDGYYPAYELYTETLRKGIFEEKGKQMRLVVGRNRKVQSVEEI